MNFTALSGGLLAGFLFLALLGMIELGRRLGISKRTIEDHVRHACVKLRALNRVQAVALASKAGLIDPQPEA